MSDNIKFARPYAKAAFKLARDAGRLPEWSEMLDLAALIMGDEAVGDLAASPHLTRRQTADMVLRIAGDRFDGAFSNLIRLLAENDRLPILPDIAVMYEELRREEEMRLKVRVISAIGLTGEQEERMRRALAARFEREVEMQAEVDSDLLGGAVIYAGDTVIDGSIRGRLQKLANRLID